MGILGFNDHLFLSGNIRMSLAEINSLFFNLSILGDVAKHHKLYISQSNKYSTLLFKTK